ncbi:MAG TPA: hypothetical protein VGM51_01740 [Armatimonadota bacterium]|jgi:hypothetical protein
MTDAALDEFWQRAMSAIKGRIIQPTMWRALEQLKPLLIEDDTLILGLSSGLAYHASHLTSSDRRNAVENVLSDMLGKRTSFRIIEGDTLEDWEQAKIRDAAAQSSNVAKRVARDRGRALEESWEDVSDEIYRVYSRIPLKQLPQNRAAFFKAALPLLNDARQKYMTGDNGKEETSQRAYARTIEKVATLSDLPPTWVALELQKLAERDR